MKSKTRFQTPKAILAAALLATMPTGALHAADIFWLGGTASYTNAANWTNGIIPTINDNAINSSGAGNIVQINSADPAWNVIDIIAANQPDTIGAFEQNGSTVTINNGWFRLGVGAGSTGSYTLNDGTLVVNGGRIRVGEDGAGIFNMNGGVITKGGDNFAIADGPATSSGIVNQSGGVINSSSELWVGNALGTGTYNFSGGTINLSNWLAVGRSGGNGTFVMTGGTFNKASGGNFIVADNAAGVFQQSAGSIVSATEMWVGQAGNGNGQYDLSGTGQITVNNWLAVGREGGDGVMNISGGSLVKGGNGDNRIVIGAGGGSVGTINQTGGTVTNLTSQTWIGEGGTGTWNIDGGTATLTTLHIAENGSSTGTLNLNGGTVNAFEIGTGSTSGFSTLNLNGGTLAATGHNPNFLRNLTLAQVKIGGAIFDSKGFDITVAQSLFDGFENGGGGLTKNGAGTLTLTGVNAYIGATIVNGGALKTTTDSTGAGDYTVVDGAALGVKVQFANAQLNVANLTVGGAAGAALDLDLGSFGNPFAAPLNVIGTFTANGTTTINLADSLPQLGQFPLVQYAARAGSGNFVLGSVPTGIAATIVTNVNGTSIDLNITAVNLPRWDGQAGGNWDIGLTENWINIGTGLGTTYGEGNAVLFDDNATGTTTVNLVTTVNPSSVTANNSGLSYTLAGTGKISGNASLTKSGSGTFTIANTGGNNYTGATVINGGVLSVTNLANGGLPSAIGASTAGPTNLVLGSGALSYGGPVVSINRGYSVQATNSTIETQGDLALSGGVVAGLNSGFVKRGPARLTYAASGSNTLSGGFNPGFHVAAGTMVFDGSNGGQTNRSLSEFWVGGTPDIGAAMILTNTTLIIDSWIGVGRGNGSVGNTSSVSLYNSTMNVGNVSLGFWNNLAGNLATQFLSLTNSVINNNGQFNLGESGGSTATLNLNGTSVITNRGDVNLAGSAGAAATININGTSLFGSRNRILLGRNGGTGSIVISESGRLFGGAWFSVGDGAAGNGSLLVKDSGSVFVGDLNITDNSTSVGLLTVQDNALVSGGAVFLGKQTGGIGTGVMSGGTVIARGGDFQMGASGSATWTQTGGQVLATNWAVIGRNTGGSGVYTISGGSLNQFNAGNQLIVAENGTGMLNISGTAQVKSVGTFIVGKGGSGNGTVNLNGGTLTVPQMIGGAGVSAVNFNGSTIVAGPSANANFIAGLTTATVKSGGVNIDSGANVINVGQALLDGAEGGGLTKTGSGTLRLNGINTYTGATLINAGTLGGTGTIASPVTIASGATIAPGASIGTLTINNGLTLSAGSSTSVEISFDGNVVSSDLVTGLTSVTYAGALVVTNVGTNALVSGQVYKLFNSASASGNFSSVTILPSGTGTFNPATGELTISSTGVLTVNPPAVVNGNLILAGTGGTANGSYSIVTSTNVAAPVSTWTTNTVGTFDGSGSFSNGIPISTSEPARFFLLRTP